MNEDYLQTGLNKFFQRDSSSNEMTEDRASHEVEQISGSNLASGISKSPDGKLVVNWDKKQVVVSDSANNRVVIGRIDGTDDDVYGIRIYNDEGNLVFDVTSGDANIANRITVGDSDIILDGNNRRILVSDGVTNRIVIGQI